MNKEISAAYASLSPDKRFLVDAAVNIALKRDADIQKILRIVKTLSPEQQELYLKHLRQLAAGQPAPDFSA